MGFKIGAVLEDSWRDPQMSFRGVEIIFMSWHYHSFGLGWIITSNISNRYEFPAQRPVTRNFDVFLICVWINDWVNNREAGDLRRYCAHYDVIVKSRRQRVNFYYKQNKVRIFNHLLTGDMLYSGIFKLRDLPCCFRIVSRKGFVGKHSEGFCGFGSLDKNVVKSITKIIIHNIRNTVRSLSMPKWQEHPKT